MITFNTTPAAYFAPHWPLLNRPMTKRWISSSFDPSEEANASALFEKSLAGFLVGREYSESDVHAPATSGASNAFVIQFHFPAEKANQ
jgi:hypothetical protein